MFEWDKKKSDANLSKHGMSFLEAKALWDDPFSVEFPAKNLDEPRFLLIGKIKGIHWSAIYTYRKKAIRIISVRRSRKREIEIYEKSES